MNAKQAARRHQQYVWPIAGGAIGFLVGIMPVKAFIPLDIGIAVWCAAMVLVTVLSAHRVGARVGVILAGLLLAVPCFLRATPLARALLMCFMLTPLAAAAAMVVGPPLDSFRARLAYIFTWGGTCQVKWRARGFDGAAFLQFLATTAILAAALAVVSAAPAHDLGLLVRWLAGGVMALAFAEMATAGFPFMGALLGVTVPPWMNSPYRSASVSEFWTRRWNIWTSEKLVRPYCFAPLARRSPVLALWVSFALSGLGHALLAYMALRGSKWQIACLCGAFFLVQPLLIGAERWMKVRRWRPAARHAWTLAALATTSPLFVEPALQVVAPDRGGLGQALPQAAAALAVMVLLCGGVCLGSLAARPAVEAEPEHCTDPRPA